MTFWRLTHCMKNRINNNIHVMLMFFSVQSMHATKYAARIEVSDTGILLISIILSSYRIDLTRVLFKVKSDYRLLYTSVPKHDQIALINLLGFFFSRLVQNIRSKLLCLVFCFASKRSGSGHGLRSCHRLCGFFHLRLRRYKQIDVVCTNCLISACDNSTNHILFCFYFFFCFSLFTFSLLIIVIQVASLLWPLPALSLYRFVILL